MPTAFIPNPDFPEEMAADEEFSDGLAAAAEGVRVAVEAAARDAGAPWMPRKGHDTIEVQVTDEGVYVVNTDHGGHLMEWGSIRNPPLAPLRRGASAAGLRVEES